jgi:outer membrane immunogenic protein
MRIDGLKLWLTAAAVGGFLPVSAVLAADLPVKALAPVAYYDWSGAYVGVHAGYGGGMKDWTDSTFDYAARGFLAGGQIGINKQIASFVFGLELDGSWANISGSQNILFGGPLLGGLETTTVNSRIDGLVTFAGRAGLAADRWFVFAKGGLAGAWERHSFNDAVTIFAPPSQFSASASGSEFRWAPMAGVGAEYALGGNWSVIAEYDFMHFGTRAVTLRGSSTQSGVTTPLVSDFSISQDAVHVVKVGANYRFGGIAVDPVYPPVKAAAGTNWTGAFVGAQGGYGFGHKEWPDFADGAVPDFGKYDVKGWLAGFDGGVNVQSGVFVFGVEGEWMWTGIKGGQTVTQNLGGGFSTVMNLNTTIDWLAIASARAGFVVGDRLLIYGKGGVAIASEKHSVNQTESIPGVGSAVIDVNATAVHSGVVGGVGAEYALGGNWSIKGEYDYIRMIGQNFTGTGFEAINAPPTVGQIAFAQSFGRMRQDLNLFKLGVNYHFNPVPAAISVRY